MLCFLNRKKRYILERVIWALMGLEFVVCVTLYTIIVVKIVKSERKMQPQRHIGNTNRCVMRYAISITLIFHVHRFIFSQTKRRGILGYKTASRLRVVEILFILWCVRGCRWVKNIIIFWPCSIYLENVQDFLLYQGQRVNYAHFDAVLHWT